jgi:nucleoside-diphosphate-sugar epimerase
VFAGYIHWCENAEVLNSLGTSYRALVLGASGALGSAFVQVLQADTACAQVVGLSRNSQPAFRLEDEASMVAVAAALVAEAQGPFHLIIDATGALTIDGQGPELSALDALPAQAAAHFVDYKAEAIAW